MFNVACKKHDVVRYVVMPYDTFNLDDNQQPTTVPAPAPATAVRR